MNNPLVSVVIPVYNGELYIAECIEQMLNQSYKNLEIIVVNDGSTDKTCQIAKSYPVKLIEFPQNRGNAIGKNAGMNAATGELIHFMDVDDAINLDFYKNMVSAIIETGAETACCEIINQLKPHRTTLIPERKVFYSTNEKLKATNAGRWGYTVRYLFKMTFLKEHNIQFEDGRFIEDMPFSLAAVFFSKSIVLVPDATYTYIKRENSIMTNRNKEHRKKRHRDLRHAKEIRHKFARKHKFKIPGVPTGKFFLFFVKWFT